MISKLLIAACLVLPVAAMATDENKMTPQQQKKASCNKDAGEKNLTGDERKKFMSDCLKADSGAAAGDKHLTAQQQRMSTCSKEAGDKKLAGDDRKKFMSTCLKG
jgi:hypothetical protein